MSNVAVNSFTSRVYILYIPPVSTFSSSTFRPQSVLMHYVCQTDRRLFPH